MGRKKKFIDKKESSTFHVVHRSQQDKANEGDKEASEFVLVPSGPPRDSRSQGEGNAHGKGKDTHGVGLAGAKRDHINALGLPNDGYDYEQHLKPMGGGTFVSKGGKVQHFAEGNSQGARAGGPKFIIPEEALPSGELLDRQLEAVTISEKVMDEDMRRALAGGLAGIGEEDTDDDESNMLDDDFVVQAAGPVGDEGFDFDAHVARLMEASARATGVRQRTADDDLPTRGLRRLRRDADSESDDDHRFGEGRGPGSDDSGEIDDALLEGLDIGGAVSGAVGGEGTEERALLESAFERTLAAYDSDEWGELEEDDDRVQGHWDLEQHDYANTCLNDFLAAQEDARWTEGIQRLPPDQRPIAAATLAIERAPRASDATVGGGGEAAADDTGSTGAVNVGGDGPGGDRGGIAGSAATASPATKSTGPRLGKLRGLGEGPVLPEGEDEDEDEDELHDIEHHNEYLRNKPADQWDCETIVSTYSNLDNHPSMLGTGRKAKPRRPRRSPATAASEGVDGGEGQVTLSKKTGLPLGVLPERSFPDTGMVSLAVGKNDGEKRHTEETAEEKKLRKAHVKQKKKEKRVQKKDTKVAFTTEAKVISHALANPEAPQNRSVFSYS